MAITCLCVIQSAQEVSEPSSSYIVRSAIWQSIWSLNVYPQLKFFLLQLLHNALPIFVSLVRRSVLHDPLYPICGLQLESLEHFFSCVHMPRLFG